MIFCHSSLLLLVYVDNQNLDLAGNRYPLKGHIEAEDFSKDIDVQRGLCGILWGQTDYFSYENIKSKKWLIAKIEKNNEIIRVNYHNRYKFRKGYVVHHGSLRICSNYIWKNRNNKDMAEEGSLLQLNNIAGSKEWVVEYKKNMSYYNPVKGLPLKLYRISE